MSSTLNKKKRSYIADVTTITDDETYATDKQIKRQKMIFIEKEMHKMRSIFKNHDSNWGKIIQTEINKPLSKNDKYTLSFHELIMDKYLDDICQDYNPYWDSEYLVNYAKHDTKNARWKKVCEQYLWLNGEDADYVRCLNKHDEKYKTRENVEIAWENIQKLHELENVEIIL